MEKLNIGLIGFGKMGQAIAYRLRQSNISVFCFDLNQESLDQATKIGIVPADSLQKLAEHTSIFWVMVPVGPSVEKTIHELQKYIKKGAIIIDGGNSKFFDSIVRYEQLKEKEIHFLDCGTSGGLQAKELGFSLMVGGDKSVYEQVEPLLKIIAAPGGYNYMGPAGAGHYVKMVHNAIEYGILQSYAEGFHLLKDGQYKNLDLQKIATTWQNGSVIRSWLLNLAKNIFTKNIDVSSFDGKIAQGGTGKWAVEEAEKQNVTFSVIKESLQVRNESQKTGGNYATKLVALLRNQFGGHEAKKIKK